MAKKLFWKEPNTIQLAYEALQEGNALVGTSDTVLGLIALPTKAGVQLLDRIKGRNNKPYIVLLDSFEQAKQFVRSIDLLQIENLAQACWPGPVTLIVNAQSKVAQEIQSKEGTIAIRIPDHEPLRALARRTGGLFSTSANITGNVVARSVSELDPTILNNVAYVIDDQESKNNAQASTIIDCTKQPFVVVREGAYPVQKLQTISGIRIEMKK